MANLLQVVVLFFLTGGLVVGFSAAGHWLSAAISLMLGVCWAAVDWFGFKSRSAADNAPRRRAGDPFMDGLGLVGFCGLAGWAVWFGMSNWLALLGVLLALAAWDLGRFTLRMSVVLDATAAERLERVHLVRLGVALGIGLVVGGLALLVRISLDFGWALVIGAAAIIALSRAARGLVR
ncbi:MAG: hypothetical protein Q7U75_19575 [Desulfobacterales bacterium]|nr:hypothetical protein [Desulfobacterales bacterium]